ncbi:MAG: hypothetical protein AAF961_10960, partial [Planctomycetota bacterium]
MDDQLAFALPYDLARCGATGSARTRISSPASEESLVRKLVVCFFLATILLANQRPAEAILQFQTAFIAEYIDDHDNEEYVELVKRKARCWVCHQGKKKVNRNAYGEQLAKLLDQKKDKENEEKIIKAFQLVGKMHSKPKDKRSPTFAKLIADGKL